MVLFSVWNGITIRHNSLQEIADIIVGLNPNPKRFTTNEWLVKAGEGGTYQAAWDSNPLAISSAYSLESLQAAGVTAGIQVTPYIVIRGKPAWDEAEFKQIVDCAAVATRVVLNLEPGGPYWDGPTTQDALLNEYVQPLLDALGDNASKIEIATIPRQWVIDAFGGSGVLAVWTSKFPVTSWECYDATAPDLDVALSMARVTQWANETGWGKTPPHKIPIVQQSRISAWASTAYCRHGMQCWHLDGD